MIHGSRWSWALTSRALSPPHPLWNYASIEISQHSCPTPPCFDPTLLIPRSGDGASGTPPTKWPKGAGEPDGAKVKSARSQPGNAVTLPCSDRPFPVRTFAPGTCPTLVAAASHSVMHGTINNDGAAGGKSPPAPLFQRGEWRRWRFCELSNKLLGTKVPPPRLPTGRVVGTEHGPQRNAGQESFMEMSRRLEGVCHLSRSGRETARGLQTVAPHTAVPARPWHNSDTAEAANR